MTERVLVVDFGAQYTQLIARRVRESGVYCEIAPFDRAEDALDGASDKPRAIILSGGPASVTHEFTPRAPESVFELNVPVLGICYGEQAMCAQLGGRVSASDQREFGRAEVETTDVCPLFDGVWRPGERHTVWMSHGDRVDALPPGFRTVAISEGAPFAAIANDERRFYAGAVPSRGRAHARRRRVAKKLHPHDRRVPR